MCQNEFIAGSLASHLASQHGIYHAHLLADKELGEVCISVPTKPKVWTSTHYPVTGKWELPCPRLPISPPWKGRWLQLGPLVVLCLQVLA